jgi:hypothetical protein
MGRIFVGVAGGPVSLSDTDHGVAALSGSFRVHFRCARLDLGRLTGLVPPTGRQWDRRGSCPLAPTGRP